MSTKAILVVLPVVILLGVTACGGGGGGASGISVTVSPPTQTLPANGQQAFTATVNGAPPGASGVAWSVREGAVGGDVANDGLYTAPPAGGVFHVVATSIADGAKSATAVVTVQTVAVSVDPPTKTLPVNGQQTFTATVTGTTPSTSGVTWSIAEGASGGSITNGGLYTAPPARGVYHVVATSVSDTTKSASAAVTVQSGDVNGVIQ